MRFQGFTFIYCGQNLKKHQQHTMCNDEVTNENEQTAEKHTLR